MRLHAKCIRTHKRDGSARMSSGVEGEDIFSLPSFRLLPCPSGPLRPEIDRKSFFGVFGNRFSAVIADIRPNVPIQCPAALPESGGRRGASVVLRKSSAFQRLPSENLQSDNHGDSNDGKRRGQAVFTLSTHSCVRMHFVCSRMQSVCTFCPRARS